MKNIINICHLHWSVRNILLPNSNSRKNANSRLSGWELNPLHFHSGPVLYQLRYGECFQEINFTFCIDIVGRFREVNGILMIEMLSNSWVCKDNRTQTGTCCFLGWGSCCFLYTENSWLTFDQTKQDFHMVSFIVFLYIVS